MDVTVMKKKTFKRQLNNGGFTLVEMIVVLIIMVILLSLTVGGIMAWQDWSKMKQYNSHAENIFMAAQTQLSEYFSGGSLEREVQTPVDKSTGLIRFSEDGSNGTMSISMITDPDGNAYDWNEVWSSGDSAEYQGTIVSVSSTPGDYAKFLKGETLDPGTALLFKLVTAYISDKSILNDSSIILEFSPDAAQVLAVCYSKDNALSYSDDDAGAVCARDRKETVRNGLGIGYYGVYNLSMPLKGKTDNTLFLEAGAFELRNEEVLDALYVPLVDQEIFGTGAAHTFMLNIYDPELEGQNKTMSLEFDVVGGNSLPYDMGSAQGDNAVEMKAVYYKDGTALPVEDGQEEPVFRVPVWIEYTAKGDRAIHIALDAADIRAQSLLYERAMKLTDSSLEDDKAQEAAEALSRHTVFTDSVWM